MATLYIKEFANLAEVNHGRIAMCGQEPALATQAISISGSSTQSAAFGPSTRFIEFHCDATCSIAIGFNPTAAASADRIKQDERVYRGVIPGDKIAVITNS